MDVLGYENKVNAGEKQQNVDEVCHGVISMTDPSRSQRMDQSSTTTAQPGWRSGWRPPPLMY